MSHYPQPEGIDIMGTIRVTVGYQIESVNKVPLQAMGQEFPTYVDVPDLRFCTDDLEVDEAIFDQAIREGRASEMLQGRLPLGAIFKGYQMSSDQ